MKKKIFIIIAIFFIALIIGGYFVLRSSFALNKIRSIAVSKIQNIVKREVSIGNISGDLFRGITISDIAIAKNNELSEGNLIDVEKIEARYSLIKLFRHKFVVDKIEIVKPRIFLEIDEKGKINIPEFPKQEPKEEKKEPLLKFLLSNAEIKSAEISIVDKRDSINLAINDLNVTINGNYIDKALYNGEVQADKANISLQNVTKQVSNISLDFSMIDDTINLSNLGLRIGQSSIKGFGEVINGKTQKVDISIDSKIALNDFKEFAPQLKNLAGLINIDIKAKGEIPNISGICKLNSDQIQINNLIVNKTYGEAEFSTKDLELKDMTIQIGNGKANINAGVKLTDGKISSYQGKISIDRFDTSEIISGITETESSLNGYLNGEIKIKGKELRPDSIKANGEINIVNAKVKIPQAKPNSKSEYKDISIGNIKSDIDIDNSQITMNVNRDKMNMALKGKLNDDASLKLSMNLNGIDIAEMSSIAMGEPIINGQGQVYANAEMKIVNSAFLKSMGIKDNREQGRLIKDIKDIRGNVKINVPTIDISKINKENEKIKVHIGSFNGNLTINDENIKTDDLTLLLDGAKCLILADVKAEKTPKINAKMILDSIMIEKYKSLIGENIPINSGLVEGEINIYGDMNALDGNGEIFIHSLSIGERPIDPIEIPLSIKSNKLTVPELLISSDGEQIRTFFEFDPNGDYDVKIDSSPISIGKIYSNFMAVKGKEIIQYSEEKKRTATPDGNLQIFISGNGNIKSPSLDGRIDINDLSYNGEQFGDGECLIKVGNDKANVELRLLDQTVITDVQASIKQPFSFSANLKLEDINVEPALRIAKIGEMFDLHLTGDILAYGDGEHPMDITIDGSLEKITFNVGQHNWVNKSPIDIKLKNRKFSIDSLQMDSQDGSLLLNASAELSISKDNPQIDVNAIVKIDDFNLSVASDIAQIPKPLEGKIDCDILAIGNINSPNVLIDVNGSEIKYDQIDIEGFSSEITYKENILEVQKFLMRLFDGEANLTYSMPLDLKDKDALLPQKLMDTNMRLSLNAKDLDIGILSKLAPTVESSQGKIENVNIDVSGRIKQPRVKGLITLKDGFVKLTSVPVPIEDINGQVTIQNSKIDLGEDMYELSNSEYETSLELSLKLDKGECNAKGNINIPKDFIDYALKPKPDLTPTENILSIIKNPDENIKYPKLSFNVNAKDINVSAWIKSTDSNPLPIDGNVSALANIRGFVYNPSGEIIIAPINLIVNDYEIKNSGIVKITLSDRKLAIDDFKLLLRSSKLANEQEGTINLSGNVNINDKTIDLNCSGERLHPGLASFVLNKQNTNNGASKIIINRGDVGFNIGIKGYLDSPIIDVSVNGKDVSMPVVMSGQDLLREKEAKIDKLLCDLSYGNGIIDVKTINLNTFGNTMDVKGKVPVDISFFPAKVVFPDKDIDVKLTMNDFNMEFIDEFVDIVQDFKGSAKADISLLGKVTDPKLIGSLKLQDASCNIVAMNSLQGKSQKNNEKALNVNKINLKITMDGSKIAIDDASFKIGDGSYKANGKLEMGDKLKPQAFEILFKTEPASLKPFAELAGEQIASQLSGDIAVQGKLTGDFRDFAGKPITEVLKQIIGEVDIKPEGINILMSGHRITNPKRVYADFKKGRLYMPSFGLADTTPGVASGINIGAMGLWEIGGDKSFNITTYVDMGFLSEFLGKPELMQGRFGLKLEARGNEIRCFWPPTQDDHSLKLIFGNANIDRLEGLITFKDQNLNIEKLWLASGNNFVSISGLIPVDGRQMSVQFDARLNDMSILSLVDKDISESGGNGTIGATITGDIKKIIANEEPVNFIGSCVFNNLSANFERAYVQFSDLKVDVDFDSRSTPSIIFRDVRGKMNDGEFVLDTSRKPGIAIIWDKQRGYRIGEFMNIALSLKDCMVYQPDMYSIIFDADPIRFRGNMDAPKITGNMTIKKGQYVETIQSLIQNLLSSREIGTKASLDYPLVKNLELDVDVVRGTMRMNNGLVDAEAEFTARVTGSPADPRVRANGRITEGSFEYLNRTFKITKGEFSNESRIDPKYEIVAETELSQDQMGIDASQGSNLKIQMDVKGSLTERTVDFKVLGGGPALQQLPDLSQNQIAILLATGSTSDQFLSRTMSTSSQLLMEPARLYVESYAEKMLRLKELKLQADPRNPREARVMAVKPIMEQVSMTLDVGYAGRQWFGLQREVGRNFAVAGKVSQEGDWGFDLKLKKDFK
ncbi:MAG: AsmA family protein [Candidatus Poribacteria bacterium]